LKISNLNREQKFLYFLLYIPCFLLGKNLDNDIWFILNSGRYVLQNGIPHIEPFTIHQGMSFVMQQWLSAVMFWTTYNKFGEIGLVLFVVIFYMLFVYMTFKLCMLLSQDNFFVSYIVSLISIVLIRFFMVQRPYIFLFIIILIEIYLLEKYVQLNKNIYLVPLIFLSILLVNLEAAMWPILFVIQLPYIIDSFKFKFSFIEGHGYRKVALLISTLGMFAAGVINPYGIKAVTYLFHSYGYSEINNLVSEMKCPDINYLLGKIIFATIFLVFFAFIIYKKDKYKLRYCLLTMGTAYMAMSSVRSYPLFIICGIIPLSFYFKNINIKGFEIKSDKKTLLLRKVLIILLASIVIFIFIFNNIQHSDNNQQELIKSTDYLQKYNNYDIKDLRVYSPYNEGGYLEFRGFKVYIDTRADVFLKSNNNKYDIMKEFVQLQSGDIYYKNVLDKYNFEFLLVSKYDILYNYLNYDGNYKLIYSSGDYKIYELLNKYK